MKKRDRICERQTLKLKIDESGNAVWSFSAVKESVPCKKVLIKFPNHNKRIMNRRRFSHKKKTNSQAKNLISKSDLPWNIKKAVTRALNRNRNSNGYHIQNHNIVQYFAECGLMDGHFNAKTVELSKTFGFKPRNFDLHHQMPICWGGKNNAANMTLIQRALHVRLHKLTTDLLQKKFAHGTDRYNVAEHYIMLPELPAVLTRKNIADYFYGFDDLAVTRGKNISNRTVGDNIEKDKQIPKPPKQVLTNSETNGQTGGKKTSLKNILSERQQQIIPAPPKAAWGQTLSDKTKPVVIKRERRTGSKGPWEFIGERNAR